MAPHGETFRSKVAVRRGHVEAPRGARGVSRVAALSGPAHECRKAVAALFGSRRMTCGRMCRQPSAPAASIERGCTGLPAVWRCFLLLATCTVFFRPLCQVARGLGLDPGAAPKPKAARRPSADPDKPRPVKPPRPPKVEAAGGGAAKAAAAQAGLLGLWCLGSSFLQQPRPARQCCHPPCCSGCSWPALRIHFCSAAATPPAPPALCTPAGGAPPPERPPRPPSAPRVKVKRPRGWNTWAPSEKWQDDPVIDSGDCRRFLLHGICCMQAGFAADLGAGLRGRWRA